MIKKLGGVPMSSYRLVQKWQTEAEIENSTLQTRADRLKIEVEGLNKQLKVHHLYLKSLNARADVENYLLRVAAGKEPLPDKARCLALAQKLGLEPEFMEAHGIDPDRVLKQQ